MNDKLKDYINRELEIIADNGLTDGNIDIIYRLLCMLSEASNIAYKDAKTAYYKSMGASAARENIPAAEHYTDAYDRYLESKREYRYNQTDECKRRLMDALEDYMYTFYEKMETMLRDSECKEERDSIYHYLSRLKRLTE